MASTHHHIILHIVFRTKDSRPLISPEIESRLHAYMAGILRDETAAVIETGGMPDHVHLLIRILPDRALADVMRIVKSKTSRWVHRNFPERGDFAWQTGYAAFSVSESRCEQVRVYIRNQKDHHKKTGFREELIRFLDACEIDYDERYL